MPTNRRVLRSILGLVVLLALSLPAGHQTAHADEDVSGNSFLHAEARSGSNTAEPDDITSTDYIDGFSDSLTATPAASPDGEGVGISEQTTILDVDQGPTQNVLRSFTSEATTTARVTGSGEGFGTNRVRVTFSFKRDTTMSLSGSLDATHNVEGDPSGDFVALCSSVTLDFRGSDDIFSSNAENGLCTDQPVPSVPVSETAQLRANEIYTFVIDSFALLEPGISGLPPNLETVARWNVNVSFGAQPNVECGDTIVRSFTLNTDLNCTEDGLIIGADNITIDLGGHRIKGDGEPGDFGIDNQFDDGHDGVVVRNGEIEGFRIGVFMEGAEGNTLARLLVASNTDAGVVVQNTTGERPNVIRNVTARGNAAQGFFLSASKKDKLLDNFAEDNGDVGILLGAADGNPAIDHVLDGNRSERNGADGIAVTEGSSGNRLIENKSNLNEFDGIFIENSSSNKLIENRVSTNKQNGIHLKNSGSNHVLGSRINENVFTGLRLDQSALNLIKSNIVNLNRFGVVLVNFSNDNQLIGNTANSSLRGDGFLLSQATNNDLKVNVARANSRNGFFVASGQLNTLIGNTAGASTTNGFVVQDAATQTHLLNNVSNSNQGYGFWTLSETATGSNNRARGNGLGQCEAPPTSTICSS